MFNYEQLLRLFYPVRSLTFLGIFCPVRLFHHVRLLIFGESPPRFMLFIYLSTSIWNFKSCPIFRIRPNQTHFSQRCGSTYLLSSDAPNQCATAGTPAFARQ